MNYTSTGSGTGDQGRIRWVSSASETRSGLKIIMYYSIISWGGLTGRAAQLPPNAVPCSAFGIPGKGFEVRWAVLVVAVDDHPTECSVALSVISTWPNNGMILWLQEERYSQSRGALAMPDPRVLSVIVNLRYCTNCRCRLHCESVRFAALTWCTGASGLCLSACSRSRLSINEKLLRLPKTSGSAIHSRIQRCSLTRNP